jgi:hypothetical protein
MRAVMASSSRLWQLAEQRDETSPFLHGLAPPLHLGCLGDAETVSLVLQTQASENLRPSFSEQEAVDLARCAGNHPYLVQVLCREALALGDLETAKESVAADPSVRYFFQVDDELLAPLERALMRRLADLDEGASVEQLTTADESASLVLGRLVYLKRLGLIRSLDEHTYEIASSIRTQWLRNSR